jgi:malate-CoA ligase subunit alpha
MAILIDEHTRVVVQGITGRIGRFHAEEMIDYGTQVVAGVTPGQGGETVLGRPVFNTMKDAVAQTGATASIVFVPPPFAADSLMEAADAGIRFCVCITDGIPMHDMLKVKRYMRRYRAQQKMTLTGPNCAGTISPGRALLGIMPGHIYLPGRVGVIGRSGTLGYEAASQMKALGIGVSTSVGIGGDPVNGSSFRDHLALFEADPDTDAVVMVGEIGGPQEVEGAEYVREHMTKPVIAYIAGLSAPKGRKMGHAGAIVSAVGESAQEKIEALTAAGITGAPNPSCLGETVARVLADHGLLGSCSAAGTSSAVGGSSTAPIPLIDHYEQQPTRESALLEDRRE